MAGATTPVSQAMAGHKIWVSNCGCVRVWMLVYNYGLTELTELTEWSDLWTWASPSPDNDGLDAIFNASECKEWFSFISNYTSDDSVMQKQCESAVALCT